MMLLNIKKIFISDKPDFAKNIGYTSLFSLCTFDGVALWRSIL